jgi:putative mRNA 3-end processing factor
MSLLLENTDFGLYCPVGDFYIDPWRPVPWAIITHAHSDHARPGCGRYLTAAPGVEVLRERLDPWAEVEGIAYGRTITHRGVQISLHPAGHILGSAQVRLEHAGHVCVVSGDYKLLPDPTCEAFEPLRCHVFVTESTFGLPIYRWRPPEGLLVEIHDWWRANQERGRTSVLYAYSLGKGQRVVAGLDPAVGPILVHGAIDRYLPIYRRSGVTLPATERATDENSRQTRGRAIVVAPPSAMGTPWLRKFGEISTAIASGWMQIRGARRRRAVDRGFALSDHADWDGLRWAIQATGAEQVWVTHGYVSVMVRWLREQGFGARGLATRFEGELEDEGEEGPDNRGQGSGVSGQEVQPKAAPSDP